MISTVVLLLCLTSFVIQSEALSCLPCEPAKICKDINLKVCKVGTAKDMCGCCDVCAKAEGETCGGIWNHGGTCSKDLNCHPNPDPTRNQDPGTCSTKPLPPGYKPRFFK